MILDTYSNITVDGTPCSLENDVMYFNDCTLRCVRVLKDDSLMYVREENINIQSFNKPNQFISVSDMIGFFILVTIISMYLSSFLIEVNKLIIN